MSSVAQKAVIDKLLSTAAVTALIEQRATPQLAPQGKEGGKKPHLVILHPPGQVNVQTYSGPGAVSYTPIIVACVGDTYEQATSLSQPVVEALNPTGWTGSQMWGETEVGSCQVDDSFDRSSLPELADEIGAPCEFVAFMLEHATKPS